MRIGGAEQRIRKKGEKKGRRGEEKGEEGGEGTLLRVFCVEEMRV